MDSPQHDELLPIVTSWMKEGIDRGFEQGIEQGFIQGFAQGCKQGMEQGEKNLLLQIVEKKFGKLVPQFRQQLENLSSEQVRKLGNILFELSSMDDVAQWVRDSCNS